MTQSLNFVLKSQWKTVHHIPSKVWSRIQTCITILGSKYENHKKASDVLNIDTLEDRREILSLKFAKKCLENEKMKNMFPLNEKSHQMNTRKREKYRVQYSNTERLKNSAITYMQNLLNQQWILK